MLVAMKSTLSHARLDQNMTAAAAQDNRRLNIGPAQLHTEAGTMMSSAGTSVFTETCGQVRPAKLSRTV